MYGHVCTYFSTGLPSRIGLKSKNTPKSGCGDAYICIVVCLINKVFCLYVWLHSHQFIKVIQQVEGALRCDIINQQQERWLATLKQNKLLFMSSTA